MRVAIVRIKGPVRTDPDTKKTLELLSLKKRNSCVVKELTNNLKGMLEKAKHSITWGEIDEETLNLIEARKKNKFYALQPPKKGFGRKGIKIPYSKGGAYGYRGKAINDLIKRMV